MHLPPGARTAAAGSLAVAPGAATLAALGRPGAGDIRRARRLLAAGAALAVLDAAGVLLVTRSFWVDWAHQPAPLGPGTLLIATALVAGVAASTVTLLAGLLRLPGVAVSGPVLVRQLLDAVVIAGAVCFGAWTLVADPTRLLGDATPPACKAMLGGGAFTAVAIGLAIVVSLRTPRPRGPVAWVAGAIVLVSASGMGLAAGVRCAWQPVVLAGVIGLPVALLTLGWAVRAVGRAAEPVGAPARSGAPGQPSAPGRSGASGPAAASGPPAGPGTGAGLNGAGLDGDNGSDGAFPYPLDSPYPPESLHRLAVITFAPIAVISGFLIYHLARGGQLEAFAVGAGIVEGSALVAGHYLALLDARRCALRLAEREAHFRQLAHTDPLTGLPNRRGLLKELNDKVRDGGPPYVLLGLDLDGFKNINDMRGHDVGDAVLAEVGRRLRTNLRPGDLAARLGGDEFAVLMWARPAEARPIAERLLGVLSRPYEQPGGLVFLSASIGLAGCATAQDIPSLLRNADLALRFAKQCGKSRVEQYDADYERRLVRRTTLEHELRGAVERDEFYLVYQPVVALPSVRTAGAEALLRWHHPRLGLVEPGEFIAVAEESGVIVRLGTFVLHQACHQLSQWLTAGHDVWVSVNVSPYELHSPEYVGQVADVLRAHRVPPQRLVLEVTEQVVSPDRAELIRRLTELRATGVRIALDDFGAGYNSLGQLRNLPVDILKIDHSLVAELDPSRGRCAKPLVDVVAELGHRLGLEVIAEGVTVREQHDQVVQAGCRFAQGEMFGLPVPAEHLEARLAAAQPQPSRVLPASLVQDMGAVDSGREMRQA